MARVTLLPWVEVEAGSKGKGPPKEKEGRRIRVCRLLACPERSANFEGSNNPVSKK